MLMKTGERKLHSGQNPMIKLFGNDEKKWIHTIDRTEHRREQKNEPNSNWASTNQFEATYRLVVLPVHSDALHIDQVVAKVKVYQHKHDKQNFSQMNKKSIQIA